MTIKRFILGPVLIVLVGLGLYTYVQPQERAEPAIRAAVKSRPTSPQRYDDGRQAVGEAVVTRGLAGH